jgi:hypothetical protein
MRVVLAGKIFQIKGLRPKYCKQTSLPQAGPLFFFFPVLIIAD